MPTFRPHLTPMLSNSKAINSRVKNFSFPSHCCCGRLDKQTVDNCPIISGAEQLDVVIS
jgi:hypothetical protein